MRCFRRHFEPNSTTDSLAAFLSGPHADPAGSISDRLEQMRMVMAPLEGASAKLIAGELSDRVSVTANGGSLVLTGLIIPERKTEQGTLLRSYGTIWLEIARRLGDDWSQAFKIPPDKWEDDCRGF